MAQAASQNMETAAPYIAGALAVGVGGEALLPLVASIPGAPIFGVDGLLGSSAMATPVGVGAIGGAVNATSQNIQTGSINPVDVAYAALAGGLGTQLGAGFLWNVGVNAATGAADTATNNAIAGKPLSQGTLTGAMVNGVAAGIGFGIGAGIQSGMSAAADSAMNGYNWAGTGVLSGQAGTNLLTPNNIPVIGGAVGSSIGSEAGTAAINYVKKQTGK